MKSLRLKRLIITRMVGLVIVLCLTGAVVAAGQLVQGIRNRLIEKQIKLEESLDSAVHRAVVADALVQYNQEIISVSAMVPRQDEVGQVVEAIDNEARRFDVTVLVLKIHEEPEYDENGVVVQQTGLTRLIRMKIEGTGEPLALINFMHGMENLPFLLNPVSLSLDSEAGGARAAEPVARAPIMERSTEQIAKPPAASALLKMDLLLTAMAEAS